MRFKILCLALLVLAGQMAVEGQTPPAATELWFAPRTDEAGFLDLFTDRAVSASGYGYQDWSTGLARVNVIQVPDSFLLQNMANAGTPAHPAWVLNAQAAQVISFLQAHNLKLAVRFAMFSPDNVTSLTNNFLCGYSLEGIAHQQGPTGIESRFLRVSQALSGHLDYVLEDEPLSHASDVRGTDTDHQCLVAPSVVASSVAQNMALASTYFPGVLFVEAEPPGALMGRGTIGGQPGEGPGGGTAELTDYLTYLRQETEKSKAPMPVSIRLDVDWYNDAQHKFVWNDPSMGLPAFIGAIQNQMLPYSMIFDTNGPDSAPDNLNGKYFNRMSDQPGTMPSDRIATSDVPMAGSDWVNSSLTNAQAFRQLLFNLNLAPPRDAVIQTWDYLPRQALPESAAGTMTAFLQGFLQLNP